MSDNPYATPKADLSKEFTLVQGTLQSGIEGRYSFSMDGVWSHAWKSTKGAKAPLLLGVIVFFAVTVALTQALALANLDGQAYLERGEFALGYLLSALAGLIISPVTVPMVAGLVMMSARRAVGEEIRLGQMFAYYDRVVPLVILSFISTVLMYAGFILCVLPGIYLSVGYVLAAPALVDKNLTPWQALEASRKAIHHSWLSVFLLFLVTTILFTVVSVPLFTMVWSMPWMMLCLGTLYATVFGVGADEPIVSPSEQP